MQLILWIAFIAFVLVMLAIDLGVFNRKTHVVSIREGLRWTILCAALAFAFSGLTFFVYKYHWFNMGLNGSSIKSGTDAAIKFITGYLIEMSLSLDNIFVIALVFSFFSVPRLYQHRTLFWGIMGALIMRGLMIAAGVTLIRKFEWIVYVFGALLIFTALKILFAGEEKVRPDRNLMVRLFRKIYPVTGHFDNEKFFTRLNGKQAVTPLMLALLVIETTDVLFAVDSIPAVLAITDEAFLVFTSNIFAILCLRSMYFALAGMIARFRYLKYSLVVLLGFIGVKLLLTHHYQVPILTSLFLIIAILTTGIAASILITKKTEPPAITPPKIKIPEPDKSTSKNQTIAAGK